MNVASLRACLFTVALAALPVSHAAERVEESRNWFDDPFFAVSSSIGSCQLPRGPLMTKEEMDHDSHARVERGTRCYQQGECRRPNSYLYDPDIAAQVRAALNASNLLRGTSLWVTVQRRWIFIQGCVDRMSKKKRLESIAAAVPDVEHVFVDVTTNPRKPAPYQVSTH
jgi:hypothetical protein